LLLTGASALIFRLETGEVRLVAGEVLSCALCGHSALSDLCMTGEVLIQQPQQI
jgi:hypothetical protein